MISSGVNDFKPWTPEEKNQIRSDYLKGKSLDYIGVQCKRHPNVVCLELMRQNIAIGENRLSQHKRFDDYGQFIITDIDIKKDETDDIYDPYDLEPHYNILEYIGSKIMKFFSYFV
jgi:hypothetical protein